MGRGKKLIAVFGGHLYEEKEYSFLEALSSNCDKQGYAICAFTFTKESMLDDALAREELRLVRLASALELSAIVLLFESLDNPILIEEIIALGRTKGIPVFYTGGSHHGCINLTLNYKKAFRSIVEHVVTHHGCSRVYMVAGIEGNSYSDERIDAYREVLEENGIPFEKSHVGYGDFWDRPTREVVHRFLQGKEIPEAIVCANDSMAIAACSVIKENGLRVPEDIIVTGFDAITSGLLNVPSISTVGPDFAQEARLIMDRITGVEPADEADLEIASLIRLGGSCGCGDDGSADMMVSTINESFFDINWHVQYMNQILEQAAAQESLEDLSGTIAENISIWSSQFHFVGLLGELFVDPAAQQEETAEAATEADTPIPEYREFFRCEDGEMTGVADGYAQADFAPGLERLLDRETGMKLLVLRLMNSGGRTYGYTMAGFRDFVNRDIRRCDEFSRFLATALHMVLSNRALGLLNRNLIQANKEIEKKSVMDYLTGIYNRRGFFGELERELGQEENQGRLLTIFSIDMDGLKYINDTFGHKDGDFAIRVMAGAIKHFASRNGFAARYGGDEFACALITDQDIFLPADLVRSRIDGVLQNQAAVRAKEYPITASIGSTCARIDGDLDIEGMIRIADEAMYQDKLDRKKNRQA